VTIKLSELKAIRAAMTPGPWEATRSRDEQSDIWIDAPSQSHLVGDTRMSERPTLDAAGIVATHNAADVLIEIDDAAREYVSAILASGRGTPARRSVAIAALNAALAKVQP